MVYQNFLFGSYLFICTPVIPKFLFCYAVGPYLVRNYYNTLSIFFFSFFLLIFSKEYY